LDAVSYPEAVDNSIEGIFFLLDGTANEGYHPSLASGILQGKGEPESPSPLRGGVGEGSDPSVNSPRVSLEKSGISPSLFSSDYKTVIQTKGKL
jgi:hypothetical protein